MLHMWKQRTVAPESLPRKLCPVSFRNCGEVLQCAAAFGADANERFIGVLGVAVGALEQEGSLLLRVGGAYYVMP